MPPAPRPMMPARLLGLGVLPRCPAEALPAAGGLAPSRPLPLRTGGDPAPQCPAAFPARRRGSTRRAQPPARRRGPRPGRARSPTRRQQTTGSRGANPPRCRALPCRGREPRRAEFRPPPAQAAGGRPAGVPGRRGRRSQRYGSPSRTGLGRGPRRPAERGRGAAAGVWDGRGRAAGAAAAGGCCRSGAARRALPQKMSAGRWLPAWCWLPALLWGGAGGYVVVSSVSWPLPDGGAAADELHSSSTEEALPALLEETGGLWKQSYPASAYREDAALGSGPAARRPEQGAAPSRMFSYRREGGGAPRRAGTARFLARYNTWGFVATRAAHGKIQGMPYGNCLLLSDGPVNNSTGIPFFYVTLKDNTVADLLKNPMASLTLPETDGNFCRDVRNRVAFLMLQP
ncbi:protein CREG2 isoform X2 [Falco naumanni]|uniref:protein CREG2 isoform X2 n=1 Tax=Falco naumanni TaxID=148594 RepID=UPI001ADE3539|nr:protein CREG2 isoform X2 [Falco naumanni]